MENSIKATTLCQFWLEKDEKLVVGSEYFYKEKSMVLSSPETQALQESLVAALKNHEILWRSLVELNFLKKC